MFRKNRLVWKVNGVILLILVPVLGVSSYVTNRARERDALQSARQVSGVISQTIVQAIRGSMMNRDTVVMGDLFERLKSDDPTFQEIRLVSHRGRVVISTADADQPDLEAGSWPCSVCHATENDTPELAVGSLSGVSESEADGRVVSVVTPIYGDENCSNAGCHADVGTFSILGFLQTDYSLSRVDDLIASQFLLNSLALFISLVLCVGATWWMVDRLVGKRIRTLRDGAERVAQKDFDFRFRDHRKDGIARLAETFDNMVSELCSALSELTRTKEYLEGIVESSADIIITVDPEGLIKTFNTGAEEILGYRREEVIGRRIEMLFADPGERNTAIARLDHADNVVNYDTHFLTKGGQVRDVILTLSRLRTSDGVPVGTFGISKDVSKERELQRDLIRKERLAAVGEAVTGIHHALKNLLGSLKGGSYMVNLGLEEEDRALLGEGWAMVTEGIGHVTDLSSRMLQYAGEWELRVEHVVVGAVVEAALSSTNALAQEKGITLRREIASPAMTMWCDPELVHSAIVDLLVNALEACEEKRYSASEVPEVILRAYCSGAGEEVVLEVEDNGEGMSVGTREKLFDPFFSTKRGTGTGIGLALVRRIARMHGGSVSVESEPCLGSTLRLSLPLRAQLDAKEELNAKESVGR